MKPTLRVLYAEDNPIDADLAVTQFRRSAPDLDLEVLETGELCQDRLGRDSFDVLLLDDHLPGLSGIEVLTQLRASGHSIPVVMLTVVGDEDAVARALLAGADDYVTKGGDYLTRLPDLLRALVARVKNRAAPDGPSPAGSQRTRRVLYIEPRRTDAAATEKHFASHAPHLRLRIVERAVEALDLLALESDFDLVMSDLRAPDLNALEFFHEMQRRGISLPFMVIAKDGDEQTAVALLRLGASDYIVKRDGYLTQLPHSIDHALHRFHLDRTTNRLREDLEALNRSLDQKVAARTAELRQEIKERQQVEEALRASENHLAVTLQSIGDAVIATDAQGLVRRMNPTAERLTGWSFDEASARPLRDVFRIVNAETRTPVVDPVHEVMKAGAAVGLANHTTLLSKEGPEYQIANTAAPISDGHGTVQGVVLVFKDVTEEYRVQRLIRDREEQLRLITDAIPSSITRVGGDRRYVFSNATFAKWLGLEVSGILGRTQTEVLPTVGWERMLPYIERAHAGEAVTYEVVVPTASDGLVHALISLTPTLDHKGAPSGYIAVGTNISEQKAAEERLRKSERVLRMAGRTARLAGWAIDLPDFNATFSDEFRSLLELPEDRALDISGVLALIAPEWFDMAKRVFVACVTDGTPFDVQGEIITASGRRLWLRSTGEAEKDEAGAIVRMHGALQDIDVQKRSERRIQEQLDELLRWQTVTINREERAQELKQEVNELLASLNLPPRYSSAPRS